MTDDMVDRLWFEIADIQAAAREGSTRPVAREVGF
jgi:hypothetical protein